MDRDTLKKVQSVFLEIALEVRRVCEENNISYFLSDGTCLGAVRHQGFIPWDDDLDIGMLREDYDRFRAIANEKLDPRYCFQDWNTDPAYPHPFGKVRKKGTRYVGAKECELSEDGFYVDIFPMDYAPENPEDRKRQMRKQLHLYRIKLMKSGCRPWMEGETVLLKKRLGYIPYQIAAAFCSQEALIRKYEAVSKAPRGSIVYEQEAVSVSHEFPADLLRNLEKIPFAGELFPCPQDYDTYLRVLYGEYMQLPPEDQRENRHQIRILQF